jgi:hypothetical protein
LKYFTESSVIYRTPIFPTPAFMLGKKQAQHSALAMTFKVFIWNKSRLKPNSAVFRIPSMNAGVRKMKVQVCNK